MEAVGRWFTSSASRVGGEGSRTVALVFNDITERKRREANQAFLVDISEDLTRLSHEEEIMRTVCAKLAAHLNLTCYQYVDVDEERAEVTIRYFWHALDVPSILGTYPIERFMPPNGLHVLRAGESSIINDVQNEFMDDSAAMAALKAGTAAQKISAYVTVPYSQAGQWKAYFAAADSSPRRWTSQEIELIQEVSHRVLPRIERVRAEAALRASESRLRALVTAGSHPIYRMSSDWRQIYQLDGRDFLADTVEPIKDWLTGYILPEDRPRVMAAVEEAIRNKSLFELEHRVRRADGGIAWVLSRAVPIFGPQDKVLEWFARSSAICREVPSPAASPRAGARPAHPP